MTSWCLQTCHYYFKNGNIMRTSYRKNKNKNVPVGKYLLPFSAEL